MDAALRLLEAFTLDGPELGVTELSGRLSLPKATVYRLASTLAHRGYLQQSVASKRYRLGVKVWEIGWQAVGQFGLRELAAEHLDRLRDAAQETVHLAVLEGDRAVYIDKRKSPQPVQAVSRIGGAAPAYCVSTGKALLAHQGPEVIEAIAARGLTRYTAKTITDAAELRRDLERVRRRGYAVNNGGWQPEVCGIAAPIRDYCGRVVASVGVCVPVLHFSTKNVKRMTSLVVATAGAISGGLGFRGNAAEAAVDRNPSQPGVS